MTRWLLGLAVAAGGATTAFGQLPGSNPYGGYGGYGGYGAYGGYGGNGGYGYPNGGYTGAGAPYQSGAGGMQFAPNFYNRQTQPVSPYLNLLRGTNPAVNYYYGARPGTVGAGGGYGGGAIPIGGNSQLRTGFLPAAANPTQEPVQLPEAGAEISSLPPSGHPVYYGAPGRFAGGGFGSAGRTGVTGNQPPAATRRTGTGTAPRR